MKPEWMHYQKGILPPVVTRQELQEMKVHLEEEKNDEHYV